MSNKKTEVNESKKTTKYDEKVQKKAAAKRQAKKDKSVGTIIGIVVVIALVALFASFPIRAYNQIHKTVAYVGGEKVEQRELDYYYNMSVSNFLQQYGSYASMMGLNTNEDFSKQLYSEYMTWDDYFTQLAMESITSSRALQKAANDANFQYDVTDEYNNFIDVMKNTADSEGVSFKQFVTMMYGENATLNRVSDLIKNSIRTNAFFDEQTSAFEPAQEDIDAYYQNSPKYYDSVDYYIYTVEADVTSDSTEEEKTAAMADAKEKAEVAKGDIDVVGDLMEGRTYATTASYALCEWLFDDARKAKEEGIVEDTTNSKVYAVQFVKRYLDQEPTADIRVLILDQEKGVKGADIVDEWKKGAATEASFGEIVDKYSEDNSMPGGLLTGLGSDALDNGIAQWLFDKSRKAGDVEVLNIDDGYEYVVYYVKQGLPGWASSIIDSIKSEKSNEYLETIRKGITVEDPKGNLNYLKALELEKEAMAQQNAGEAE